MVACWEGQCEGQKIFKGALARLLRIQERRATKRVVDPSAGFRMGAAVSASEWAPIAEEVAAIKKAGVPFEDAAFPASFASIGDAIKHGDAYVWRRPADWLGGAPGAAAPSLFGAADAVAPDDVLEGKIASSAASRNRAGATDGDLTTRWAEGREGDGAGEFLVLSSSNDVAIAAFEDGRQVDLTHDFHRIQL